MEQVASSHFLRAFLLYVNFTVRLCEFLVISWRIFREDESATLLRREKFIVLKVGEKISKKSQNAPLFFGRLAQLVRASRLHRECLGFESLIAHHRRFFGRIAQLVRAPR